MMVVVIRFIKTK